MKSSISGIWPFTELGAGGAKLTIWYMSAVTFSPLKGAAPVSISYRITPREKMSER
jgi:hypothetical protein